MKSSSIILSALVTALLLQFSVIARQPAKLATKQVNVSYVQLPKKPISEKNNRTYSVQTQLFTYQSGYNESSISNEVKISEFKKLDKEGYVQIFIEFSPFTIKTLEKKTNISTVKTKSGAKQTVTRYYYAIRYNISVSAKANIDYGKRLNSSYTEGGDYTHNTNDFESQEALDAYYRTQSGDIQYKLKNDFIKRAKEKVIKEINDDYGYQKIQTGAYIYLLKKSKNKEFAGFEDAFNNVNRVFANMRYDEPTTAMEADLKDAIDFYKKIADAYKGEKKKDAKIKYAALYNLANIYYFIDNFEKAKGYAQQAIENDEYKSGSSAGKLLLKEITHSENLVKINGVESRHIKLEQ